MANTADYDDYNGGSLLATAVTLLIITYLAVSLRFFVRITITKSLNWDDWFMLISQIGFTVACVFIFLGISYGMGHHNDSLSTEAVVQASKYQDLALVIYIADMMFVKLSIGFFLLRLVVQRRYIYTIWISMVIIFIWSTVLFFWDLFLCNPVAAQWDASIIQQTCAAPQAQINAAYALSVMSVLSDWLYALLPVFLVWKMNMSINKRLTVICVLGLGVFASVATLIRLTTLSNLEDIDDILYTGTDPMIWTLVEPGVAITAASLVTLRPLLRALNVPGFGNSEPTDVPDAHALSFRYITPGASLPNNSRKTRSRLDSASAETTLTNAKTAGRIHSEEASFGSAENILESPPHRNN
ncbi:hypothetical protein BX600DRAFT_154613 [Xylariales sp. PMI_506]|nr:hypothetical protein BX600DRAFT_154613 [Xylariales sp. PMI_506]